MPKNYAKNFYNSIAWKSLSRLIAEENYYICCRCNKPANRYIVHHIIPITPDNINDYNITMNKDNLMLLCLPCHNAVHSNDNNSIIFDSEGNVYYPPLQKQ